MTGRERFLTVLSNGKPDRLPVQVHSWMPYYLKTFLNGMDQYEAYEYFGMDPVIYMGADYKYAASDLKNWQEEYHVISKEHDGVHDWVRTISTPNGELVEKGSCNEY